MNNLQTIESAIKRLKDKMMIDHEYMDADDLGDLTTTIKGLEQMRRELLCEEYKKKVTAFRDYVLSTMPEVDNDSQHCKTWDDFYEMKWTISFGDQQVILDNQADTWQPMVDLLTEHLEEL